MEPSANHPDEPAESRRWPSRLVAPVVLFLICVGFFWKIVLTNQYTWLESPDLANQVMPWLQVQAGEWHRGRVPLWDPYLWGGQSLIGQAQPGVAYPLNWILFLLPLQDGWLRQSYVHWYFVIIHFMAAWFAYLLCRDLKRSRAASIAAGCVFALGGWVGVNDWPQMLNGAIWAPLVLLYALRSLRGVRPVASAAASGAFFGLAWLGGHHQIPIFLALTMGGVWLYHIWRRGRPDWSVAKLAAVFLVFLFLVSAVQTMPAYEYGKLAKRWVGANDAVGWKDPVPYSVHTQYSLIPTSLIAIVLPGYNRNGDPFIGIGALTLALLAVGMAWKKEAPVRLFAAIAAGGLLFSLGRNNVFHGILYAVVPLVEKARTASFAVFIYHFGIAALTAYGLDYFTVESESVWPRRATRGLLLFSLVIFTLVVALAVGQKPPGDDRFLIVALVALLLAALLHGWRNDHVSRSTAIALAAGLMLIEFGNLGGIWWPNREETTRTIYLRKMAQDSDVAAFLLSVPWPVRMEVSDKDMPYNFGDWYGIDQFGGYVASLPLSLLRLPWHTARSKQIFGVNYSVKRDPPAADQELVFKSPGGLNVYWNKTAFPRVWTVHEAARVKDESQIQAIMGGPGMDLRRKTFLLEAAPRMETCAAADDVHLSKRNSGRVTITANMACRGMVILGDSYFPGWVAKVDGKPVKIYEAYTAIRGVVVAKGKHTIEMRYIPASVVAGGILTLCGLLGAIGLSWGAHRRQTARG